jgi:hypothetical protein
MLRTPHWGCCISVSNDENALGFGSFLLDVKKDHASNILIVIGIWHVANTVLLYEVK